MTCEERAGFLFAHGCDRPATTQCGGCAKAICEGHARTRDEGMTFCIACYKDQERQAIEEEGKGKEDRTRRAAHADDPYLYSFYYFPDYDYYDADDYGAFDAAEAAPAEAEAFEKDDLGS